MTAQSTLYAFITVSSATAEKVGFIGLGNMGRGMADNLLQKVKDAHGVLVNGMKPSYTEVSLINGLCVFLL